MDKFKDLVRKMTTHNPLFSKTEDQHQYIPIPQTLPDEPWFFCSLCSRFYTFNDLIDGCICPHCDKDLFVIPWYEFDEYLDKSSILFRDPRRRLPQRRKSWVG